MGCLEEMCRHNMKLGMFIRTGAMVAREASENHLSTPALPLVVGQRAGSRSGKMGRHPILSLPSLREGQHLSTAT